MLATGQLTIGRVFRLLPKVLGQESISLWVLFSGIGGALNLLGVMLQYGFGVGGLIASLIALVCVGLLLAALFHLLGLGRMTVQILMVSVMDPVFTGASIVVTGAVSTTVFRLMELEAPEILAA